MNDNVFFATVVKSLDALKLTIQRIDPLPFSENANKKMAESIEQFISQLVTDSENLALREGNDTISAKHVQDANKKIIGSRSNRLISLANAIGGVFLGVFIPFAFNLIMGTQLPQNNLIIMIITGIIGTALVAYGFLKE
jgi:histone H3/H4